MMSFTNFEAEEIKTLALKGKLGEIIKTIQKKIAHYPKINFVKFWSARKVI